MLKEWLTKKYLSINDPAIFDLIFADMLNIPKSQDYVGWVFVAIDKWGKYFAKANFRMYR